MKTKPIYALGGIVPEQVVSELLSEGLHRDEIVDFFESYDNEDFCDFN